MDSGTRLSSACRGQSQIGRTRCAQVTALALCKHNKNDLLLLKLRRHVRHGRARGMFWRYHQVPKEALAVLEVRLARPGNMSICACRGVVCMPKNEAISAHVLPDAQSGTLARHRGSCCCCLSCEGKGTCKSYMCTALTSGPGKVHIGCWASA